MIKKNQQVLARTENTSDSYSSDESSSKPSKKQVSSKLRSIDITLENNIKFLCLKLYLKYLSYVDKIKTNNSKAILFQPYKPSLLTIKSYKNIIYYS